MIFTLATASQDAAFTELTKKNWNLSTQLRKQEDKIWELQAELCNLKVAATTQTTKMKGNNKGLHPYARYKK